MELDDDTLLAGVRHTCHVFRAGWFGALLPFAADGDACLDDTYHIFDAFIGRVFVLKPALQITDWFLQTCNTEFLGAIVQLRRILYQLRPVLGFTE